MHVYTCRKIIYMAIHCFNANIDTAITEICTQNLKLIAFASKYIIFHAYITL